MDRTRSACEAEMRRLWETGRAAWPGLELGAEAFCAWLGARLSTDGPEVEVGQLVAADLYLVASCLLEVPGAAKAFIEGPLANAERHLRRVLPEEEGGGDVLQELRVRLLTPGADGSPPRLAQYSGRGALAVWLRMAVVRSGISARRGQRRTESSDEVIVAQVSDHDPELSALRRRYRDEMVAIFAEAVGATPDSERALLRLHYVQGSTLNELAALHQTSRSAIHRRLERAREELMERIAGLVRERLRLGESQQGSMLRIFHGDLREHLGRLLRE